MVRYGIITKMTNAFSNTFGQSSSKISKSREWFEAIQKGDRQMAKKLLKSGVHINIRNGRGRTALMIATYNRDLKMVHYLIEQEADVNIQDDIKNSPFLHAAAEGYLDILKLMDQKGDVKVVNRYGGIGIIPASERGHYETLKWLLEHTDSDVNHVNDLGWTALLEAIILGDGSQKYKEIIDLLIEHGASVDIADRDGVTAMEHAEKRGYMNIVSCLTI